MSHIVTIRTQIRDPVAIGLACQRLRLPPPQPGTFQLFNEQATGWGVQLRGWRYLLVCQTESGELKYDNFGGRWGEPAELNAFLQRYTIEAATLAARRQGHSVVEQPLASGAVKLLIQIGGAS